ncbi:hypothetical protein CU098_009722 [Rhizopus stolonifer]|uniref:RRM domain-containing protein n=1 Tax=Rhizopus stolonifer TaxID=4846 RepID=A0A367KJC2_RHIST|nr:hypothetical protein CU098_009722 [Rhizopus stolonifer]
MLVLNRNKQNMSAATPTEEKQIITPSTEEDSHKVFVGNLSYSTTKDSLKAFFESTGKVVDAIVVKKYNRPKGFGFVAFATLAEAEKAIKDLDKKELDGREISIQIAKPRKPKSETTEKKKKTSKKSRKPSQSKEDSIEDIKEDKEEAKKEVKKADKREDKKTQEPAIDPVSSVDAVKEDESKEPKPKTTVFVANLPRNFKVKQLTELFKDYEVESALVAIKRNGISKRYGFVELKTVEEMKRVLTEFIDVEVEGSLIHVSAATSEKNAPRKRKSPKKPTSSASASETEPEAKKTSKPSKRSNRNKKSANKKKVSEGLEAAHEAQDAVKELKKEDGIEAAKEAQGAVKELKKEDGTEAAKEAQNAVKELKKEDGVEAAKEAKEAVKDLKKEDGAKSAAAANKGTSKE